MADPTRIPGDLQIAGRCRAAGYDPAPTRSTFFALESNTEFPIPLTDARVWDAIATVLPGTSATDDLALDGGTFATSPPTIQTGDVKTTTVTRYARFPNVAIPDNYVAGETVTLRLTAGMITTVADGSATIDVEAWRIDEDNTLGATDLCSTAAQSINSMTFADKDFVLTPTTLNPGDILDVRITISVTDTATGTAVIGALSTLKLLADTKG